MGGSFFPLGEPPRFVSCSSLMTAARSSFRSTRDIRRELSLNDATVRELIKPFDLELAPVYTIYADQSGHDLLNSEVQHAGRPD